MRNTRAPGPPSSVSSSSGHGLVYATHRPRGPQLAFTPESPESGPNKRKTKLIVILGIALPVLACIIGIAAWAVTTDVLRITPRANDNNYNRFGHQGKTRIDNMQSRSDEDIDVFVLHGITPPTSPSPNSSTKKVSSSTIASTTGATVSTGQIMASPKPSDILSKLISDMPSPKTPKNFIVFAPIADTENTDSQRKGRRFDSKIIHRDGDDLVAEESVISEDTSQELSFDKAPFNRKRNPTVGSLSFKPEIGSRGHKKIYKKEKLNRNPRLLPMDSTSEGPPNFLKRPSKGDFITFPANTKRPVNAISNRNGGITRHNSNFPRLNFQNQNQNNINGFQNFDKKNSAVDHQSFKNPSSGFESGQSPNSNLNYQPSSSQQISQPSFNKQENPSSQFQFMGSSTSHNKERNQHMHRNQDMQPNQNMYNQRPSSFPNQQNVASQTQFSSPHNSQANYPSVPQNVFPPESSPSSNGGPQYFAPPPQTFHTKINYEQPSSKFQSSSSSMSNYEKVAQTSVDQPGTDGTHHHHHHHHHHEPVPSNSDPVGDVNYSDVPRVNDADRLGSIGIGLGPSRGITVQIGGGGGGLGGLLPLGTLGIVKNIASALLPRPQLGLNSKVFLGVEVGKGSGFQIG